MSNDFVAPNTVYEDSYGPALTSVPAPYNNSHNPSIENNCTFNPLLRSGLNSTNTIFQPINSPISTENRIELGTNPDFTGSWDFFSSEAAHSQFTYSGAVSKPSVQDSRAIPTWSNNFGLTDVTSDPFHDHDASGNEIDASITPVTAGYDRPAVFQPLPCTIGRQIDIHPPFTSGGRYTNDNAISSSVAAWNGTVTDDDYWMAMTNGFPVIQAQENLPARDIRLDTLNRDIMTDLHKKSCQGPEGSEQQSIAKPRAVCTKCKKTFSRKSDLDRHDAKHQSGGNEWLCGVKECTYEGSYRLDKMVSHMKNRHFKGNDCDIVLSVESTSRIDHDVPRYCFPGCGDCAFSQNFLQWRGYASGLYFCIRWQRKGLKVRGDWFNASSIMSKDGKGLKKLIMADYKE